MIEQSNNNNGSGRQIDTLAIFNELQNHQVKTKEVIDEYDSDVHDQCLVKMMKVQSEIKHGGLRTDKAKLSAMYDLIEISTTCYRTFDKILKLK